MLLPSANCASCTVQAARQQSDRVGADEMGQRRKNPHAVALGKLAHEGRMKRITPARRKEIARIANAARWAKHRAKDKAAPQ
jgi:hypothetical protein